MKLLRNDKKNIIILLILYLIANIFILLNYNGLYWDDWVLHNHSFKTIHTMFSEMYDKAAYPTSIMHYFLVNLGNGVIGYRLLTVIFCSYKGSLYIKSWERPIFFLKRNKFFITAFFLFAPYIAEELLL